ncbi:RNA-binding protein Pasilla [Hydra vulgaris]|uniref:RNA-binding protein Pasilla n=1 Tax=Hydra vulgaris TaxID=6087 RepID=A0ABM4CJ48_HYDVU
MSEEYSYREDDVPEEGAYTSSRKRSYNDEGSERHSSKRTHTESTPLLKVLIPNYAAGAIIGKGGANIGELQSRYGAKIRLSPNGEFYPGTEERIVILTGDVSQIIDLHNYIIDKVHADSMEGPKGMRDEDRGQKVKIVCPNATAGLVIGRGGSTIKSLQEETKAKIMISGRDESKVMGERIITIAGNTEQRIEASRQVIGKIAADAENMSNKNLTYSGSGRNSNGVSNYSHLGNNDIGQTLQGSFSALGSMLGNLQHNQKSQQLLSSLTQNPLALLSQSGLANQLGLGGSNSGGGFGQMGQNFGSVTNQIKTTVSIQMEIPDVLVGAILGKHGKTVHEFIQFSGAKIQFSAKNDFAPGTTDRILTIQGDLNQTQIAYFLINQKIMQAENELGSGLQQRR